MTYNWDKIWFGSGVIVALIISWNLNQSAVLAAIHGCFGWLYVLCQIFFFLTS